MRLILLVIVAVSGVSAYAHAQPAGDAVALLPLDADQRLELYGQPVASEVARALVAGGIDVVVVGPKMAVPERARLIVDGTIKSGKGETVTLSVRIRDRRDGTILETIDATAPALTSIDRAAEELSGRVLPSVKSHLAGLEKPKDDKHIGIAPLPPQPPKPNRYLYVTATPDDPLAKALVAQSQQRWSPYEVKPVDAAQLAQAVKALAEAQANPAQVARRDDLAMTLEVVGFSVEPGTVPTGRARVHVRVVDATHAVFDRVVITDTIVGDKGLSVDALAARTAREVLAIVRPHLRRAIEAWR